MDKMISYTMYFGSKINDPDRIDVTEEMFKMFMKTFVACFFDRYTLQIGKGVRDGREQTIYQLEILLDEPYTSCARSRSDGRVYGEMASEIFIISEHYKAAFDQESVMIKAQPVLVQY